MDVLERAAIAVIVLVVVAGAILAARWFAARRRDAHRGEDLGSLAASLGLAAGTPAVLYFWGDRCVQCVTLQQPAITALTAAHDVQVARINASDDAALARRFGILTVPSTVVVGPDLRVRDINLGYADAARLAEQLAAI